MGAEYVIVSDDDGHNYVIPADKIKDWDYWLMDACDDILPSWCKTIGGSITLVKFTNYRIE